MKKKRRIRTIVPVAVSIVLSLSMLAACSDKYAEQPEVVPPSPGSQAEAESGVVGILSAGAGRTAAPASTAALASNQVQESDRPVPLLAVETVQAMHEALSRGDRTEYAQTAEIPRVMFTPESLQELQEEASAVSAAERTLELYDKFLLTAPTLQEFEHTYGSQAEIVREQRKSDWVLWVVTPLGGGAKVVDRVSIYEGAFGLAAGAAQEELADAGIRAAIEDRRFLSEIYTTPILPPEHMVALLYQAAQEGNEAAFTAAAGGKESYFARQDEAAMKPFADWVNRIGTVESLVIEPLYREELVESRVQDYDVRYGDNWHFVVVWDSLDEAGARGTYWILTTEPDGTGYRVELAFTTELNSMLSAEYYRNNEELAG
ncbi:hypothetical protein DNH61_18935 [Paenibacillus sambharensis]|uniref:Uncharacterized protein n=1 Tax=Paenibacillus sambharensis TaxID=1803190 RepID=A0A2W1L370_9BACL|nr:hypothetical protein [Paenibacillus sambharensis]PZD94468.1 hypothetical protein DNH61_18935 [Paenibacillus sambharensis]